MIIEDARSGFYGGTYNNSKNIYKFDISQHLTKMLNGIVTDSVLNINVLSNTSFPSRVILESSENIKLKVTYTKH